jgi:hypothetical protein
MTQLAVTLLLAVLAAAQRYQSEDGNYINGEVYGDYESAEAQPQRPLHPTPRSYNSAPAQRQQPAAPKPTPVAILKQINRHNEDGSYTYGFEGADGSFKVVLSPSHPSTHSPNHPQLNQLPTSSSSLRLALTVSARAGSYALSNNAPSVL